MTVALKEVALGAVTVERLRETAGPKGWARLSDAQARAGEVLAGRTVWSINSTAVGGGVAEMLRTTLAYMRAGGLDTRWLIMPGGTDFFGVTKRIHNFLHGHLGDSGPLGEEERSVYERVIADAGWGLRDVIRSGDVVVLHDPQTLGLASGLKRLGATVMWRCHIGTIRREACRARRGTSCGSTLRSRTWRCSRDAGACPRDCRSRRSGSSPPRSIRAR
ncbi:MAG: hypothetical protein ACLP4R_04750 [Solirubrobacteraceae bacterium]